MSRGRAELWIAAAGLAFLALEIHNHRFHQTDFRAYYEAASHLVRGAPLYFVTDRIAAVPFLYPPWTALLFVPFLLLGGTPASFVWYVLNVCLIVLLLRVLRRTVGSLSSLATG